MQNDHKSKASVSRFMADVAYLQKKANAFTLEQAIDKELRTTSFLDVNNPDRNGSGWSFTIFDNETPIFRINYSWYCYVPVEFIGKILDELIDGGDIEAANQTLEAEVNRQWDLRYPPVI